MVNYLVVLDGLIARMLPLCVFHVLPLVDLGQASDLLHEIIDVQDKHHFAFSEPTLDKLLWCKRNPVLKEIDEDFRELLDELALR